MDVDLGVRDHGEDLGRLKGKESIINIYTI